MVFTVGGHAQMQVATRLGIAGQHLTQRRQPGGEERFEVNVGVDAIDDGAGAVLRQARIQRLREAAEMRVRGVAETKDGVAQPGGIRPLRQRVGKTLGVGGRFAVAK